MKEIMIVSPEEARLYYSEIIPVYQAAFAGEPWNEVSKCPDRTERCVGGLSAVAVGSMCEVCLQCPSKQAYEPNELSARFDELAQTKNACWYIERDNTDITLASVGWCADAATIAREKYQDIPEMATWITQILGKEECMWLDEVFADKRRCPSGNLRNFGSFVVSMSETLGVDRVAYRTIEPRMLAVAKRDFGESARALRREAEVPDRRDFVVIELGK